MRPLVVRRPSAPSASAVPRRLRPRRWLRLLLLACWLSAAAPDDSFSCAPYSATHTQSALNANAQTCDVTVCGVVLIRGSTCGNCFGDTFLRLYSTDPTPLLLTPNDGDNGCSVQSLCSQFSYLKTSTGCTQFRVNQGCYANTACSGTASVRTFANYSAMLAPSPVPSAAPSASRAPSRAPTFRPSAVPSVGPTRRPSAAPSARPTRLPSALPTPENALTVLGVGDETQCQCSNPSCSVRLCAPAVLSTRMLCAGAGSCSGTVTLRAAEGGDLTNATAVESFRYAYARDSCSDLTLVFSCQGAAVVAASSTSNSTSGSGREALLSSSAVTIVLKVVPIISGCIFLLVWLERRRSRSRPVTPTDREAEYGDDGPLPGAVQEVQAQFLNTGALSQLMQAHGPANATELPRAVALFGDEAGAGSAGAVWNAPAVVAEQQVALVAVLGLNPVAPPMGPARLTSVPVLEVVDVSAPAPAPVHLSAASSARSARGAPADRSRPGAGTGRTLAWAE